MMAAVAPLLEVRGLRIRFRTMGTLRALLERRRDPFIDAVLDVSFTLDPGTTLGLVGESGSGKTTLGRTVIGLIRDAAGEVRFAGASVLGRSDRALRPIRREMAMMFQDPVASLSPRLTVRALVIEPFRIHGLRRARDLEDEARRLLAMVGLPADFLDRYPHELSGGQARRVGVARALALDPKLIIADEPTAGLDVSVQGDLLNLLARLQAERGIAYLLITHNLAVVRRVSALMAIMYLGRLVEAGPTTAVFRDPLHPYTQALLAATPVPDPSRRREQVELTGEIPSLRQRPPGCEFHTRCAFVQARCRSEPPAWREVAPGRQVRCHFPLAAAA
jgi:oligopeptide/dipeptide ABC transporter ATP-binding protein